MTLQSEVLVYQCLVRFANHAVSCVDEGGPVWGRIRFTMLCNMEKSLPVINSISITDFQL